MTARTEPSDKPDRDEIARDLALEWHKQRNAFYPPDSFWEWIAKRVVPRTEHERIVGELKEKLKRKIREAIEKAYPAPESVGGSELDMLITVLEEIVDKK